MSRTVSGSERGGIICSVPAQQVLVGLDALLSGASILVSRTVESSPCQRQSGALKPFIDRIGKKPLRELTAQDIRRVLADIAVTRSSRTVVVAHNAIERAIRHAKANDHVRRNVASLVRPPSGQPGRPSKSLTLDQAIACPWPERRGILCNHAQCRVEVAEGIPSHATPTVCARRRGRIPQRRLTRRSSCMRHLSASTLARPAKADGSSSSIGVAEAVHRPTTQTAAATRHAE